MKGIDVSKHQGKIDWNKVKADGIEFAIIRAGYGKSLTQKDHWFEYNYSEAKRVGIKVGAYWYTYATSEAEAEAEAKCFIECLKGKQFEMPVYYDIEENTSLPFANVLITKFCDTMEKAGYFTGFYMSESQVKSYTSQKTRQLYTLWNACWRPAQTLDAPLWQTSETGTVAGIAGNVDTDICYKNFEGIIKANGLNGFASKVAEEVEQDCGHVVAGTLDGVTYFKEV